MCTQDIRYQEPVIVMTDNDVTTLFWKYCKRNGNRYVENDYSNSGMNDL